MIISTPNWNQEFPNLVPQANGDGSDGEDGKGGRDGPQGRYYRTNKIRYREELLRRNDVKIFFGDVTTQVAEWFSRRP